jgi:uncharacterized membrane protein YdbT with pleckstrin-like domain
MKYVNSTLMSDEKLIFCTRPHRIIFMPAVIWLVISTLPIIFGHMLHLDVIGFFKIKFNILLSLIALLITLVHIFSCYITYITSEYAVTDKRVLMKVGFIRRVSLEIFLDKIESIHIKQNILGRILRYGSIIISGTGGSKDPFNYIPNPLEFRRQVQEQIH